MNHKMMNHFAWDIVLLRGISQMEINAVHHLGHIFFKSVKYKNDKIFNIVTWAESEWNFAKLPNNDKCLWDWVSWFGKNFETNWIQDFLPMQPANSKWRLEDAPGLLTVEEWLGIIQQIDYWMDFSHGILISYFLPYGIVYCSVSKTIRGLDSVVYW